MRSRGRSSAMITMHFCVCCFPTVCAKRATTSKTLCAHCSPRACRRTGSCSTRRWRPTCLTPRPGTMISRASRRHISAGKRRTRRPSGRCSRCCGKRWTRSACCRSIRTSSCRCVRCWRAWSTRVFSSTVRRSTISVKASRAPLSSSSRASGPARASRSTSSRRSSLATCCLTGSCSRPGKRQRPDGAQMPPCSKSCAASTRSSTRSSITVCSQNSNPRMPTGCSRRFPPTGASIRTFR